MAEQGSDLSCHPKCLCAFFSDVWNGGVRVLQVNRLLITLSQTYERGKADQRAGNGMIEPSYRSGQPVAACVMACIDDVFDRPIDFLAPLHGTRGRCKKRAQLSE